MATSSEIVVEIDRRAGSGPMLPQFPRGTARLADLKYGDFAFSSDCGPGGQTVRVGIERKTVRDFLGSMREGRLAMQLSGMLGDPLAEPPTLPAYDFSYLFIEGRWGRDAQGMLVGPQKWGGKWSPVKLGSQQFLYAELAQFLTSIRTGTKCRVVQTEDEEGTIREVLTLVKWFGKPWHQHKSLHAFQDNTPEISRFGRPSLGARWAFQLAGIGPDRAIAVGKLCDSAEDICFLTEKQLTAIEGIGPVLAKSILDQIRKKRSPKVK